MLKIVLLSALLLTAGVALLPGAAAACEPGTDPDYCAGRVRDLVGGCVDSVVTESDVRCT